MTKPNSAVLHKKLKDLTPDSRNANKGTPRGNQMIEDSLRQYGAGRSILLDKHGRIIAGNKTAENAGSIGLDDVIVVQTDGTKLVAVQRTDLDLNDPRARQLAIADNRASEVSLDWDVEALKGLALDGVDLAPFFTADELESFWPQNPLQGDEDEVPPVPVEPKSKLGDLYLLGNHRLLCGDSTKREDVERLMAGEKADMVFTDPPYGISIVQGNKVGGSGSTLIACEKTGRKCFMMELDPIYCDVICLRYYNATGKIPLREDGKPWKSENDAAGTENHRHSKSANGVA